MASRAEQQKRDAVAAAVELAAARLEGDRTSMVRSFLLQFYGHVPPETWCGAGAEDLYGAALSLWQFAQERAPGGRSCASSTRASTPRAGARPHGDRDRQRRHAVPGEFRDRGAQRRRPHRPSRHPSDPARDARRQGRAARSTERSTGRGNGAATALRESAMHVESSEQSDPERLAERSRPSSSACWRTSAPR